MAETMTGWIPTYLKIPKPSLIFVLASYETRHSDTQQTERRAGETENGPLLFASFCRYQIRNKFVAEGYVSPYGPSLFFILHRKQRVSKFMSCHYVTLCYWFEDTSFWCFAFCCKNTRTLRRVEQSKRRY